MPPKSIQTAPSRLPQAIGCLLLQVAALTLFLLFCGENELIAGAFFSAEAWRSAVSMIGGELVHRPEGVLVTLPLGGMIFLSLGISLLIQAIPALLGRLTGKRDSRDLAVRVIAQTKWFAPLGIWSLLWIINMLLPGMVFTLWLMRSVQMALAVSMAGWLWESTRFLLSALPDQKSSTNTANLSSRPILRRPAFWIAFGMLIYLGMMIPMNFGLWFNLQIPHGDSSMYEEHLWNTLHGKGFRSYLDQGLFLGEHIQVVHLLLLPIYVLWPSHLCLEFCGSLALALGAIPVYFLAKRNTGSELASTFVSLAYLFAFPLQYLDIAIDLKTFRPSAIGIPVMLCGILAAESRRWGWMVFCFAIALSSQEDFAIVIAPLGLWLAARGWTERQMQGTASSSDGSTSIQTRASRFASPNWQIIIGFGVAVFATVYVFAVVKLAIPWFRSGAPVHYVSYFEAFGKSPFEIVLNLLTRPDLVWRELVTSATLALLLDLLIPYGWPYRGWIRLLVGLPLFVLLAANQLTREFPGPFHHFHAPILPILAWAACAHAGNGDRFRLWKLKSQEKAATATVPRVSVQNGEAQSVSVHRMNERAFWILCCALTTGLFFSITPLGIKFWDPGSSFYWKLLYVQSERALQFEKVIAAIPPTARVASTDFVHPRFTHFERSYDYSHYPRQVANYEDKVPDDTEYIVIDCGHRYSEISRFEETREYQNQRDQWEELPIDTKGAFIVLKRIKFPDGTPAQKETK